jgi:host factor-I protein
MRNGPDSTAAVPVRAVDPENFGNRKLIRPSLSREQARMREAIPEQRYSLGKANNTSLGAAGVRLPERPQQGSRKAPPADQTHAESFYYQKQMQSKTPMVVVTRDGEQLHGIIEWYDKHCIKLNRRSGQSNLLIYKSAIRYMFKEGEENK